MKLLLSAVLLMGLLIVAGIMIQYWQSEGAASMVRVLDRIEGAVLAGDFEEAELHLSVVEEEWSRANRLWCMVVDHEEMDEVRGSLVRLRQHIRFRDPQLCMAEVSVAVHLLRHIPKKEAFSLASVL